MSLFLILLGERPLQGHIGLLGSTGLAWASDSSASETSGVHATISAATPDSGEQEAMSVIDEYGFERVDLVIEGLTHEYEVRWKLLPPTDGPPGYPGEPYIPLAVSFAMTSGERRRRGGILTTPSDVRTGRSSIRRCRQRRMA